MPSQVNSDIPPSSASVVMLSAPNTQDNPQEAFHTPPEQASLHSSDVNSVPHSAGSHVLNDPSDISELLDDEIKKFSEECGKFKLGFGEDFLSVNDDDSCKDIPLDKNSVPDENAMNDDDFCREIESFSRETERFSSYEIGEGSVNVNLVEEHNHNRSSGQGGEVSDSYTVFDVLKYLANTADKKDDGLTLLESLKRAGVKFPRPSWWSDDMKSELFNFDDEEQRK